MTQIAKFKDKMRQKQLEKTVDEIAGELSKCGITFNDSDTTIQKGELRLFVITGNPYSLLEKEEATDGLHIELKAYTSLAELVREMNLKSPKQADYIVSSITEFALRKGNIYSIGYSDSWE
jgi:hypothetical protein